MRARTLHGVGLAVAAMALSTLSIGTAGASTAAGPSTATGVSATAAGTADASGAASAPSSVSATPAKKTLCNTKFGSEAGAADNGIISNAGSLESMGAADFTCTDKKTKVKVVNVQGYFGNAGETIFNVSVRKDCKGEPCDSTKPVCEVTGVGSPTGSTFPTFDNTKIKLDSKCKVKRGTNWISVQANTENAWYWRVTGDVVGQYPADWKEAGAFGTGCTTFQNGRYMQDCIFGGDVGSPDFMFTLAKK